MWNDDWLTDWLINWLIDNNDGNDDVLMTMIIIAAKHCHSLTVNLTVCYSLFRYVTNRPPKANSAFHPRGVGKWVPASAGKAKAGMIHFVADERRVCRWNWDPSRTRAILERLIGVITTRRHTNPRLPYLTFNRFLPINVQSNLALRWPNVGLAKAVIQKPTSSV